jgi:hypothetical protein
MERYPWIIFWKKTFILELEANRPRFDRWFTINESKFSNYDITITVLYFAESDFF